MLEQVLQKLEHLPPFLFNLLLVVIALASGLIVKGLLSWYMHRNARQQLDYSLFRSIIYRLGNAVTFFLPVLALNMVVPLMELTKRVRGILSDTAEALLIVSFGFILMGVVKILEDYVIHAYDLRKPDNLRERKIRTQLQFIRKLSVAFIIILVICGILLNFDSLKKIGAGLLTGVGVGGIIIGFAAQRSLGNFLAGLQIALTQPIRIDDVLVVEGEWGRVEEITLTYVVVGIWDQRKLILPINYFIEKPFQNWTRTGAAILGTTFLYLDYTAPVEALRQEFFRLLEDNPLWDQRVKVLQVTNATDRTIEVRMLISASNSGKAYDLRCFLRERMIAFVQEKHPYCLPQTRLKQ
jgi:small-conductance mechanosensitive channel